MRVLHLISSSGFAGAEAAVANLATGLRNVGWEAIVGPLQNVRVADTGVERRLQSMGVEVKPVPCAGRWDAATVRYLREYLRRACVDVLHTHGYKADLYGYTATRTVGTALVATCHNWTGEGLLGRAYDLLDHAVLRRFRSIAAVSDSVRRSLRRFGISADRIRVIPNGVDIRAFGRGASAGSAEKGGHATIGFIGRLVPEKGVDVLLNSAPAVLEAFPETIFCIVGEGPARAEMEKLAQRLDISRSVRFLGFQSEMAEVYRSLDIVALPSRNEGAPMTVIEAMAASLPVVVSAVGGLPDIVSAEDTGILVSPNDSAAVSQALIALLASPSRRVQMGFNGHRRASAFFSCESMARSYIDLYESALHSEASC